jgi:cellulose synthase/poly-beta-1,6-N-acetylglucosamine synthase-like glycosyltransferase
MWPFELLLTLYALKIIAYLIFMRKKKIEPGADFYAEATSYTPSVDILLPMHNEEKVVIDTIRNLLEIEYKHLFIIVVDDGSTDDSLDLVAKHFKNHPKVRLLRQVNGGKSAALNKGMEVSRSEIVVTIDADTWVRPDAIKNIVHYFKDKEVAAVAGHIKVGNRVNPLTEMQYFEYITIWDNDRAFFDKVNGILVVPGALGAFRVSAVRAVGGFRSEVIAEDTELTLRLLYHGYVIRNATDAIAYTEAPDNLRMFFRQRVRWTTGLTQGLVKHGKRLFRMPNRWLARLVLPFTWLTRVILPFFLPLIDYYFIWLFFISRQYSSLAWWAAVIATEVSVNFYLLRINKEKAGILNLVILQRLYRHLLFCNYWVIFIRAIRGTLFNWSLITRKGNIKLEEETGTVPKPPIKEPKKAYDYE